MRQGFEEELIRLLTDIVALYKPDGQIFEKIAARVSGNKALILDCRLPIEAGDRLVRDLPSGLRDEFIVDEPGFQPAVEGMPPHFQVDVHRAAPKKPTPTAAAPIQ